MEQHSILSPLYELNSKITKDWRLHTQKVNFSKAIQRQHEFMQAKVKNEEQAV